MEIIANRNQLSNCLQKIQYILEKSSSLNNSENILLNTRENELEIIAFDQNCSARGTITAEINKSFPQDMFFLSTSGIGNKGFLTFAIPVHIRRLRVEDVHLS